VLGFLGGEIAVLGGIWWVAGVMAITAALRAAVPARMGSKSAETPGIDSLPGTASSGLRYLLCLWGVIWTACLAASMLGESEANWMAPGYVALVVLIGWRLDAVVNRGGAKAWAYGAAWCLSVAGVIAIHHTEWFYPVFAQRIPSPSKRWAAPLRLIDLIARMRGHQPLAHAVQKRLATLQADGSLPFVLTPTYALTSTLSFYLPDQPETYCLSWNYGMTARPVNQHDLWHPNPRHDTDSFRGRTAIVVEDANMPPNYATLLFQKGVFGSTEPIERVVVKEQGVIVGAWDITVCHDYRGLAGYVQNQPGQRRRAHPPSPQAAAPPTARRS
jgi:hypothetical protein